MSSFDLFRTKIQNSENCRIKYESSFILEGTSAVIIHVLRLNADKQAALILTDKEGPDTSLVYTYKEHNAANELIKTDYFTWNNNTYFVYEDVDIVRDVNYKKQKAYQCNVSFQVGEHCYCAYYVSSLSKYVDTTLQSNLNITDNDKPILILPQYDWLEVGLKIIIKGKPYKIIDFDIITNDKIAYISLDRDFIDKQEDKVAVDEEFLTGDVFKAGIENELSIQYGYFKTNPSVEIISKTVTVVKFIIPYGISTIDIWTKDVNKQDILTTYKVVT